MRRADFEKKVNAYRKKTEPYKHYGIEVLDIYSQEVQDFIWEDLLGEDKRGFERADIKELLVGYASRALPFESYGLKAHGKMGRGNRKKFRDFVWKEIMGEGRD